MNGRASNSRGEQIDSSSRLVERLVQESDNVHIRQRIREYLLLSGRAAQVTDVVVLCIEEACSNALRHSGSSRPTDISVERTGDAVVAIVSDHGNGFDIDRFDREATPDPLRTGGRGLWLIARLMDDLELLLDDGLTLRMTKRCD